MDGTPKICKPLGHQWCFRLHWWPAVEWAIKNRHSFKVKRKAKQHYWIRSPPWANLAEVNSAAAAPKQQDYSMCCQAMQQFSRSFHFLGQPRILSCWDAEWFKQQKPKQWGWAMQPNVNKVPWLADIFEKGRPFSSK